MKKVVLPLLVLLIPTVRALSAPPLVPGRVDSLTARLADLPRDSARLSTLQALCRAHAAEFDYEQGLRCATEAVDLSRELHDRKGEALSFRLVAMVNVYLSEYVLALEAADEALRLNLELKDTVEIANTYDLIGTAHLERRDLKEALHNSMVALELREKVGDKRLIARSHINVGNAHAECGQYEHALRNYFDALRLFHSIEDKDATASTYNNLGTIYGEMGDQQEGLKNFKAAQEIWMQVGNKQGLARVHMNLGHAYAELGEQGKALEQFGIARTLKSETNDRYGVAMANSNIADVLKDQKKYGEAMRSQRETLVLMEEIGDNEGVAGCHIAIGEILLAEQKLGEARSELRHGLQLARDGGYLLRQERCYGLLADVDSARGDHASALAHYKLHITMRDSLLDEEKLKDITRLELRFDFDKEQLTDSLKFAASLAEVENERTIERLRADKNRDRALATGGGAVLLLAGGGVWFYSDRKRRKERFQKEAAELQTQVLRSQMNPHFIFNALNSINAFVRRNDPKGASFFLSKFAGVMRGVLENSRHREVSLKDDLETLRGYIELERRRMQDKFDFTIVVDEDIDPEQVMVPPLVVQPLVENAIWHGISNKEGQGHIALVVKRQGDQLVWSIEDNGVGRRAAAAAPVAAVAQDGGGKKTSLGTTITRSRLELLQQQYGGRAGFRYEDLAQGTRVVVEMPMITT